VKKTSVSIILFTLLASAISIVSISTAQAQVPTDITICSPDDQIFGNLPNPSSPICSNPHSFITHWHLSASTANVDGTHKGLTACTSKNPLLQYFDVELKCRYWQVSNFYVRNSDPKLPTPDITLISNITRNSVDIKLDTTAWNSDAPIRYYTATVYQIPNGNSQSQSDLSNFPSTTEEILAANSQTITISGLHPSSNYIIIASASSIDGTSAASAPTPIIVTKAPLPPLPNFTLSSNSETVTTGNSILGYTITENGGPVAGFRISPDPGLGLSFDSTTGLLTGTPVALGTTTYTISGSNEAGTFSSTYTLTVDAGIPSGPTTTTVTTFLALTLIWVAWIAYRRRRAI